MRRMCACENPVSATQRWSSSPPTHQTHPPWSAAQWGASNATGRPGRQCRGGRWHLTRQQGLFDLPPLRVTRRVGQFNLNYIVCEITKDVKEVVERNHQIRERSGWKKKACPNLVACESDEEVGFPQFAHNRHTVQVQMLQVSGAARKVGAQDDAPSKQSSTSTSLKIKEIQKEIK